ncbi:hypothetical protein F2Q70_00031053 [Brassica cretica]|uniref:Uncharacterized protein n=1 Tax=Brassica cretica TaxID=69181 RepID=A0A8S9FD75_BRACR|nr:hypothetical protein F2Q70_00031053 [Brassica cretica]
MDVTKMFFITWFSSSTHLKARRLPDDFQKVFQTTSRKSSRRLPGSLLTESSLMSPFHNRSERFDFGRLMGSLLGSFLKYNALEDFQEVFQTTSKKSSRRLLGNLPGSLPDNFQKTSRLPRSLLTEFSSISSGI